MSRNLLSLVTFTSIAALAAFTAPAARADTIPAYFFNNWSIDKNCVEVGDDPADHAHAGLKFRVSATSVSSEDQSYAFETVDSTGQTWNADWSSLRLQYRAGTQMSSVPADLSCVPGQEASSPFLAMTGYTQSTEPYYEFEHWYGQATINGEVHHVLVFPRPGTGTSNVVIVLQNAGAGGVQLDQDGTIHGHDY